MSFKRLTAAREANFVTKITPLPRDPVCGKLRFVSVTATSAIMQAIDAYFDTAIKQTLVRVTESSCFFCSSSCEPTIHR